MSRRAHIGWKTKYAAALLALGDVPHAHAKMMHEDQIISLYEVHHNKLHSLEPDNHFSNLEPMLRPEHKARFPKDNAAAKKVTRIIRANDAAVNRLLARQTGDYVREPVRRQWPVGRKLQSRGFEKRRPAS